VLHGCAIPATEALMQSLRRLILICRRWVGVTAERSTATERTYLFLSGSYPLGVLISKPMNYEQFIASKAIVSQPCGFEPMPIPENRFQFQRDVVGWAVRRGCAALFEDCGLGKTVQQLDWAQQVATKCGDVLILAPLAVAQQTVREGQKFGIEVNHVSEQSEVKPGISVTNYQKLHKFDAAHFKGVVLDESSILKSFDGKYRTDLIERFARTPYRLACTATPAPNDYMELGNHAEFLGIMKREEMLAMFFTHDGGETSKWRLKGHAEDEFWKWLCSWAVNLRRPSDFGYDDGDFKLPPLVLHEHVVESTQKMDGYLFAMPASSLSERRDARKESLPERIEVSINLIGVCVENSEQKKSESSITETTTEPTGEDGKGVERRKIKSIVGDAKNTPQTKRIGTSKKGSLKTINEPIQESESSRESENTDSRLKSSIPCLNPKESCAQSADGLTSKDRLISRSSITATQPEELGEYCAPTVITGLVNSKTIQTSSLKHTNTLSQLEPWIVWCNLDCEQRALEKAFGSLAFSIFGSLSESEKEERLTAWLNGDRPILIGKPSMMGYGLNLQRCSNVLFVGLSDSYEQYYQAIRRCWRFGQKKTVNAHLVISSLEGAVLANLKRKEADSTEMANQMVKHMANISSATIRGVTRDQTEYKPMKKIKLPAWV